MSNYRRTLCARKFKLVLTLCAALPWAGTAQAQGDRIEEVVVTGTSIRGEQPVGSNLISVSRMDFEKTSAQTVQQILKAVPALSNLGQSSQGGGNTTPAIHNLGAVSSYSTLVLIDGHRFSLGRQQQPLPDPGILPPNVIERVEVLADGASSIYGSDAVAGVINFVTRRNVDGIELSGQRGFGDHYDTLSFNALAGKTFEGGYVLAAAAHSYRSELFSRNRDFLNPNHIAQGGSNFNTYNCEPATLQPGGAGNLWLGAAATSSVPNVAANAPCSTYPYSAVLPADVRTNGMIKVGYEFTPRLRVGIDAVYSDRSAKNPQARGTLQATAYQTGAQANPFYTNPAGYAGAATNQVIRWDADELLGPGAYSTDISRNYYVSSDLEYKLSDTWRVTGLVMYGHEDSITGSYGTLCGSCANLALNGTTNVNGNPTLPSIAGTSTAILNLPLTAANALDVWSPAATNRTSAAVRQRLVDSNQSAIWFYNTTQLRAGVDGKLFSLPGGDVSVAGGVEWVRYTLDINKTSPNNTGPASTGSQFLYVPLERHVTSGYGEVLIPIIGEGNAFPLVQKLSLNGSVRYDKYNDVGDTTNPKVGFDWQVVDDFKLRANWASSFVAPQLSSVGDRSRGGLTSFTCYGSACPAGGINVNSGTFRVDTAAFPSVIGLPGCTAGMSSCTVNATDGTLFNSGPANPRPSEGESWSVGFDATPSFVPGLQFSATLFNVRYINFITGTSTANALNTPSLGLITFYPGGATPAQLAAALPPFAQLQGTLPNTIYYLVSGRQGNYNNLSVQGVDASFNYMRETASAGTFSLGGSITEFTRFKQHLAGGQQFYSILNTTGANSTFGAVQTQARFNVGWQYEDWGVDLFDTFIGSYRNWSSSSVRPVTSRADGAPTGGGDKVDAQHIFDLNLRYTLPEGGFIGDALAGTTLFVNIDNLFDTDPAFYNGASGYDNYTGNPVGRVVTAGIRLRF
ncbi:MAG TPA: TonB-dependent receptor [Rhizomicrobium sp.]|nr:TonB-dependent receptor [Rhizomicrobium sp.]